MPPSTTHSHAPEQARDAVGPGGRPSPLDPLDVLLSRLSCGTSGLNSLEAGRRRLTDGPNVLEVKESEGLLRPLARQLTHPLALLLWVAAVLALTTQGATLGWRSWPSSPSTPSSPWSRSATPSTRWRHSRAYLPQHAIVVRDGADVVVDAADVVPGDLLVVREGDAVCADARMVDGAVEVDLSVINGESVPVSRISAPAVTESAGPSSDRVVEAEDVLLSGTTCTAGQARALVVRTGMATELGRIAALSRRARQQPSPLERQVRRVAWLIAGVAVAVGLAFLPLGMIAGLTFTEAAVFAIGLLVANVPEGLLPTITLALAVGVGELARHGGLVKRLSAVETLGSTDVICTDKTGTLTQNRMTGPQRLGSVGHLHPGAGHGDPTALARAIRTVHGGRPGRRNGRPDGASLCSRQPTGSIAAGTSRGSSVRPPIAFDPRIRLMSVTAETSDGTADRFTKGAPEAAREPLCPHGGGPTVPRSSPRRVGGSSCNASRSWPPRGCGSSAAHNGSRDRPPATRADAENRLDLLGFVALADPLRDAVPRAVERAHRAGIAVHVISGDSGPTAAAIARSAGIRVDSEGVVTGATVDSLTDDELDALFDPRHTGARVRPQLARGQAPDRRAAPGIAVTSWR